MGYRKKPHQGSAYDFVLVGGKISRQHDSSIGPQSRDFNHFFRFKSVCILTRIW